MHIKKKYLDFLNEAYLKKSEEVKLSDTQMKDPKSLSRLREEFAEDVLSLSNFYKTYFSDLCKRDNLTQDDLDSDYLSMQNLLDRKGFDWKSIKNLFSPEVNDILGEDIFRFIHLNSFDEKNGYIDYYFYRTVDKLGLDKNKVHLGGDGWATKDTISIPQEMLIRYKYGYHHTAYGHLMLQQAGITADEFIDDVTRILVDLLMDDWSDEVIYKIIRGKYQPNDSKFRKLLHKNGYNRGPEDFKNYHIQESDRLIINIRGVVEDLNNLFKDIREDDEEEITIKDFETQLSSLLYEFNKNIVSTGNELIIWIDFETNDPNII